MIGYLQTLGTVPGTWQTLKTCLLNAYKCQTGACVVLWQPGILGLYLDRELKEGRDTTQSQTDMQRKGIC